MTTAPSAVKPSGTPRPPAGSCSRLGVKSTGDIRAVLRAAVEAVEREHLRRLIIDDDTSSSSRFNLDSNPSRDAACPALISVDAASSDAESADAVVVERAGSLRGSSAGGDRHNLASRLKPHSEELLALAKGTNDDVIPYALLRDTCAFLRGRHDAEGGDEARGPWVHQLLKGSELCIPRPPPRHRSPELVARLAKLREQQELKEYRDLVKDVDGAVAGKGNPPFMGSFRHQAGFGLNVATMMFTGYLVGHAAMAAIDRGNTQLHPVGGVIGLIIAMLVEVVLYIIIADRADEKERRREASKVLADEAAASASAADWRPPVTLPAMAVAGSGRSVAEKKEGPRRRKGGTIKT